MKSSRAEDLLDQLRVMLAAGHSATHIQRELRIKHGLEPLEACPGEAHSDLFIDHCSQCAPRWGWLGKRERIT